MLGRVCDTCPFRFLPMDRVDPRNLAELRLKEAKLLLAILATRTRQHEVPDINLEK